MGGGGGLAQQDSAANFHTGAGGRNTTGSVAGWLAEGAAT
eukprot:gene18362-5863_t